MSKFLDDFAEFIKEQPFDIIRASEIHNGGEPETLEYVPANPCQNSYSVAKTFTMAAIGLLYDRGLVELDEKICDIFADELPEKGMDPRWQKCTVEMALTHRLGLPGGFLDIDCNPSSTFGEDYLEYMFTYPLEYDPGTDSKYSDGAFYLLSRIVEKRTGISTDNFMWEEMFYKMGFQEMAWSHCPKGHVMGATGLYVHTADMVKLGELLLKGGVYKGERFLSEEWVSLAIERGFALDWDETHRIYYKGGMCGQKLIMIPEQNRAFAVMSFGADTGIIADWVRDYNG